jgi:hypothetical protein
MFQNCMEFGEGMLSFGGLFNWLKGNRKENWIIRREKIARTQSEAGSKGFPYERLATDLMRQILVEYYPTAWAGGAIPD